MEVSHNYPVAGNAGLEVRDLPVLMVFLNSMVGSHNNPSVSTHTCTAFPYHLPLERWLIVALEKKKWSVFCPPVSSSLGPPISSYLNRVPPYKQDH